MDGDELYRNIARFLLRSEKKVVGTGVVLPSGWVLTCAHVATLASTGSKAFGREPPSDDVRIDVAGKDTRKSLTASFKDCIWGPALEGQWRTAGDYAFLKLLDEEVPDGLDLSRTPVMQLINTPLYAYGFPSDYEENGRSASLRFSNNPVKEADGLVRIHRDFVRDEFIEPGFSGAPVLLTNQAYSVVGIVKSRFISDKREVEEAYIIPGETLSKSYLKIMRTHHNTWISNAISFLEQESQKHPPRVHVQSKLSLAPSSGTNEITISRLEARMWRLARIGFNPLPNISRNGATPRGRFDYTGRKALYFSLSAEDAIRELTTRAGGDLNAAADRFTLHTFDVSCNNVFDARDPRDRGNLYVALGVDPILRWKNQKVPNRDVIVEYLIKSGFNGMIYPEIGNRHQLEASQFVLWDVDKLEEVVRAVDARDMQSVMMSVGAG